MCVRRHSVLIKKRLSTLVVGERSVLGDQTDALVLNRIPLQNRLPDLSRHLEALCWETLVLVPQGLERQGALLATIWAYLSGPASTFSDRRYHRSLVLKRNSLDLVISVILVDHRGLKLRQSDSRKLLFQLQDSG